MCVCVCVCNLRFKCLGAPQKLQKQCASITCCSSFSLNHSLCIWSGLADRLFSVPFSTVHCAWFSPHYNAPFYPCTHLGYLMLFLALCNNQSLIFIATLSSHMSTALDAAIVHVVSPCSFCPLFHARTGHLTAPT